MLRAQLISTSSLVAAGLALASTWIASNAYAQTQAPSAPPAQVATAPQTQIAEVIVTAQRRSESLQKVPDSVTALSGADLKKKQVNSAFDLQYSVPNLTIGNMQEGGRQGQTYVIRGQTQQADDAPPGVVEYLDDVPVQSQEVARSYYDMSSIQVLEGPQGTLFGRNTNGGAVLFAPNKPTDTFGGYVTGQYGNYNDRYGEAMINLPVTSALAIRLSGNIEGRDGFTQNIAGPALDNLNYQTWRAGIDFKPNSRFESYTLLNGEHANERGPGYVLTDAAPCTGPSENASCFFNKATLLNPLAFSPNPNPYLALGLTDFIDAFDKQQTLGDRTVDSPDPSFERENGFGITNTSSFSLGNVTLKNIIAYHELNTSNFNHFDDTVDMALGVDSSIHYKTFTEEFQVLGHTDDNFFRWIAGVNYFNQRQDPYSDTNPARATDNAQVALPFLLTEPYFIHLRLESFALYGQGTVDLSRWVHGLSFTGGYRYTWDSPSLTESIYQVFLPLNVAGAPAGEFCALAPSTNPKVVVNLTTCSLAANAHYNAPNWFLSLNEQLTDHVMVYLASRHGYKSGGFNSTTTDAQYFSYGPEKLTDIEPGVKSDFHIGDMAVRLNADVFYDWYSDLQLGNVVFFNGTPSSIIENSGPDGRPSVAHLYGGEASITVLPVSSLSLTLSYGYQKGVYDHFLELTTTGSIVNQSGNSFPELPAHTVSAAATWRLPINPEWGGVALTGNVSYRSEFNLSLDAASASEVSGYALANARLDWTHIMGRPIDASLFVKNLTNYTYPLGFVAGGAFGFDGRYYGEPRMFGVSLTYHFGT